MSTNSLTPALEQLNQKSIAHKIHRFSYVEGGGTAHSSVVLGVAESAVVKTLVFQDDQQQPLIVLMHGDCKVDVKALAAQTQRRKVKSCSPEQAQEWTGYQVGGTSPFGLVRPIPIYLEDSILNLPAIFINGGGRGLLVELNPNELSRAIDFQKVNVAQIKARDANQ